MSTQKTIKSKNAAAGNIYVQASFNNTLITVTDKGGNALSWASSGGQGFKGARKATPYAAQTAMQAAIERAKLHGLQEVSIYVSGVGPGREQAVRSVGSTGLRVTGIKDVTPIAHNGVRPKKPRRV